MVRSSSFLEIRNTRCWILDVRYAIRNTQYANRNTQYWILETLSLTIDNRMQKTDIRPQTTDRRPKTYEKIQFILLSCQAVWKNKPNVPGWFVVWNHANCSKHAQYFSKFYKNSQKPSCIYKIPSQKTQNTLFFRGFFCKTKPISERSTERNCLWDIWLCMHIPLKTAAKQSQF